MKRTKATSARRKRRRGSVLVEMAVITPILFAFFGFLWEFSRAEMIRHTVSTAAYEGAREAIVEGASAAEAEAASQAILDAVGVRSADIVVTPTTITPETDSVQIAITVPLNNNAVITPFFLNNLDIVEEITLNR